MLLCFRLPATALLDEDRYLAWSRSYRNAQTDRSEGEKRRSAKVTSASSKNKNMSDIDILEDYLESNLTLLGVTGLLVVFYHVIL